MHGERYESDDTFGPVILLKTILGVPPKRDEQPETDSEQEKAAE